ncbi:MAG: hypothetical protein LBH66_03065 [Oscillospiraceae bacterium]|jgi:hypothetical protein|nr:hypothetical protein [Oscillospiraceae bacterium]
MRKLGLRIAAVVVIAAVSLFGLSIASYAAELSEPKEYAVPEGFTIDEVRDEGSGAARVTLTSADGNLTLAFVTAYYGSFEGLALSDVPDDAIPGLLAEMGLQLADMDVEAEFIGDYDEDTGEEYAYIVMRDERGWQDHAIFIGDDGWVEYQSIVRKNGPLTDADWSVYYQFYGSF